VTHGAEQKLDAVDERAIEIEEDGEGQGSRELKGKGKGRADLFPSLHPNVTDLRWR
jgi:hypothetical protein